MASITPAALIADLETGLDLLSGFFNTDVVGVYDDTGQVFTDGRPLKAQVKEPSRIMKHPAENGVLVADHRVIDPVEIILPLVIRAEFYASVYQQIRSARDAGTLLNVQTRTGVYLNMAISDMPHEEDPDMFDAILLVLRLEQILYVIPGTSGALPANYSPSNPLNANTVKNGLQSAVTLGKQVLTTASSVASYASLASRL